MLLCRAEHEPKPTLLKGKTVSPLWVFRQTNRGTRRARAFLRSLGPTRAMRRTLRGNVLPCTLLKSLRHSKAGAHGTHSKRFAAKRMSSTDPDVTMTAVMLSMPRAAVDSAIGKRPAAGAAGRARWDLDFDCFLAAMMNPLGVRLQKRPDPDAFEVYLDLRHRRTI